MSNRPPLQLVRLKVTQAADLLLEMGLGAWMLYTRESSEMPDPSLGLVVGTDVTWESAFIITRHGYRVAVVGRYDVDNVRLSGAYDEVIGYDEDIKEPLLNVLQALNPAHIGLNYSLSDHAADGLTHGMFLQLQRHLAGTPFVERLTSAERVSAALRSRKHPAEVDLIKRAIVLTEGMFGQLTQFIRPGEREADIADFLHGLVREARVTTSWTPSYCPTVTAGPDSPHGHVAPGEWKTASGQLVHVDFGVRAEGFCSDLQRVWYLCRPGESEPPTDVQKAFDAVLGAIQAGAAALKPGVPGWQVDETARQYIVAAGYPEYKHALGHQLGRTTHDGAGLLGPRWPRYGDTPNLLVEPGNVVTLELGVPVSGYGFIGLEEDVLVTEKGCEYLSVPQTELVCIR